MQFPKYVLLIFLFTVHSKIFFAQANDYDAYQAAINEIKWKIGNNGPIPFKKLDTLRISHLILGTPLVETIPFKNYLDKYTHIAHFQLPLEDDLMPLKQWVETRKKAGDNAFVIELWSDQLFHQEKWERITNLFDGLIFTSVNFEKKYLDAITLNPSLEGLFDIQTLSGYWHQSLAAQLIFGGIGLENGKPLKGLRLGYAPIEAVAMHPLILKDSIRSIIEEGIAARAFPGAQVLVARKGNIIYHEAFGNHTYEGTQKLSTTDMYDMASVTKISSGLAALLKWYGEGKLQLDAPLSTYLPAAAGSNKADLKMIDLLTHQARLRAWIPFWKGTLKGNSRNPWQQHWDNNRNNDYRFKSGTFRLHPSKKFNIEVPGGLWLHRKYPDKMISYIFKSPLNAKPGYVYSDFFFILMPRLVKAQTGQDFEKYIVDQFYKPLGANTLTWNPLRYFNTSQIVPTERDTFFRMTLLQGNVHDEGAAMLHGVSGHAGLFGSANDLAKLMQLYLNKGIYGGERIIEEKAFDVFTRCPFCPDNNRGIGFDKPPVQYIPGKSTVARDASPESFGHSGYTGTFVWIDPVADLIYIFLSNRVYPTRESRAIYDLNIRPRIQQAIYDAIKK
jgi:CubicO group peptidase (beta-lactamase class C family)